jgi:hypothetical protein
MPAPVATAVPESSIHAAVLMPIRYSGRHAVDSDENVITWLVLALIVTDVAGVPLSATAFVVGLSW